MPEKRKSTGNWLLDAIGNFARDMQPKPTMETLGYVSNVMDTPASIARNTLAGKNPVKGLFNPEDRTGGRDMLETWGALGPNTEGLDFGDAAGFGVEAIADPMNMLGGALLKAANKANVAKAGANAVQDEIRWNNLMVDSAARKKRDLGQRSIDTMPYTDEFTKDVIHDRLAWLDGHSYDPVLPDLKKMVQAPRDEAARIGAVASYGITPEDVSPAGPEIQRMMDRIGVSAYTLKNLPLNERMLGSVFERLRPDVMYLRHGLAPRQLDDTLPHELIHTMRGRFPDEAAALLEAIGEPHLIPKGKKYYSKRDPTVGYTPARELAKKYPSFWSEAQATAIGNAFSGSPGITSPRFEGPLSPTAIASRQDFSTMVKTLGKHVFGGGHVSPPFADSAEAARLFDDYLAGKTMRSYSLTPTGQATETMRYADLPPLLPDEIAAMRGGSKYVKDMDPWDYIKYTDDEREAIKQGYQPPGQYQNLQDISPLLQALMGYNTVVAPNRGN